MVVVTSRLTWWQFKIESSSDRLTCLGMHKLPISSKVQITCGVTTLDFSIRGSVSDILLVAQKKTKSAIERMYHVSVIAFKRAILVRPAEYAS